MPLDYAEIDIKTTDPPETEPVTLDEAKANMRVTNSAEDTLITSLIVVAREYAELAENRAYIEQTITGKMDRFPLFIKLPRSPLMTVESINYIDTAGDSQTLSTDVYAVDTISEPGEITLKHGQSWPVTQRIHHAVTIVYTAGYGDEAADVPQRVKQAMLLMISDWFSHRSDSCGDQLYVIPRNAASLLAIDACFA